MRSLRPVLAACLLAFLVLSPAAAIAQDLGADAGALVDAGTTADPTADPGAYAHDLYGAIHGHQWILLAGLVLLGLTFVARKALPLIPGRVGAFFASDRGGAVLSLCGALGLSVGAALKNGKAVDGELMLDALAVGFTASGGWSTLRKILGWTNPPAR